MIDYYIELTGMFYITSELLSLMPPDAMAESVDRPSPTLRVHGIQTQGFEPWSSQTHDLKPDSCHNIAKLSALLGEGKNCLAQYQDNVAEWHIRS